MDTTLNASINVNEQPVKVNTVPALRRAPVRARGLFQGVALLALGALAGGGFMHSRENASVLTVNGTTISRHDFDHRCELAAGPAVAQQMVKEELQLQFARRQEVFPSDADVEAKYAALEKQPDFKKSLVSSGKTVDDVRKGIRLDLIQAALISKGVSVTEADAQAFYKSNTDPKNPNARYYQPNAVQVAVVVSDKPEDVQSALHALATGASFASVAARYSKDASRNNNGVLPVIRRGQLDPKKFPGLEDKLFALQTGQQLDNVAVAGAHWIVRCVGRSQEASIPYEKVKAECLEGAKLVKGVQVNGKTLQADSDLFQTSAGIQFSDARYSVATTAQK
jgi:parvulin-like peptidyl-prolyl isomerase